MENTNSLQNKSLQNAWNHSPTWLRILLISGILSFILLMGIGIFLGLLLGTDLVLDFEDDSGPLIKSLKVKDDIELHVNNNKIHTGSRINLPYKPYKMKHRIIT